MATQWSERLATGIEVIDDQHKELFQALDSLLGAMREGKGADELTKTIKFLGDYVVHHFGTEELLMGKYDYRSAPVHIAQHKRFIKEFELSVKQLEREGKSTLLVLNMQRSIGKWLVDHIAQTDAVFGAFLREKMMQKAA